MKIKLKKVGIIFATLIGIGSIGITIPFLASCSNSPSVPVKPNIPTEPSKPVNPNVIVDETNTFKFDITTNTLLDFTDDFIQQHWPKPNQDNGIEIIIPEQIQGYEVLHIGNISNRWFLEGAYVKKLVLNNNLKTIGYRAFAQIRFENIDLVIPDSVEYVGEQAFYFTGGIVSLKLPNNEKFTRIEKNTFMYNEIKDLIIPDSVEYIGESAFENQSGYNFTNENVSLKLSKNLKTISNRAFYNFHDSRNSTAPNKNLIIKIPNSVSYIGDNAFVTDAIVDVIFPFNTKIFFDIGAFAGTRLKKIHIQKTWTCMGAAFATESRWESISFDSNFPFDTYIRKEPDDAYPVEVACNQQSKLGKNVFGFNIEWNKNYKIPEIFRWDSRPFTNLGFSQESYSWFLYSFLPIS